MGPPSPGPSAAPVPPPLLGRLLNRLGALIPITPSAEYVATLVPPSSTANEASLLRSLRFRLLASDFTQSLRVLPHTTFPVDLHTSPRFSAPAPGAVLAGPIAVQVVDIVDIGNTLEARAAHLEREVYPAGAAGRGRDVIRTVVPGAEEGPGPRPALAVPPATATGSTGPHKLLLEDAAGRRAWAFELDRVPGIEVGGRMKLGAKVSFFFFSPLQYTGISNQKSVP